MRIDEQIRDDVIEEIKWEPQIESTEIGVTVKDGRHPNECTIFEPTGHRPQSSLGNITPSEFAMKMALAKQAA